MCLGPSWHRGCPHAPLISELLLSITRARGTPVTPGWAVPFETQQGKQGMSKEGAQPHQANAGCPDAECARCHNTTHSHVCYILHPFTSPMAFPSPGCSIPCLGTLVQALLSPVLPDSSLPCCFLKRNSRFCW